MENNKEQHPYPKIKGQFGQLIRKFENAFDSAWCRKKSPPATILKMDSMGFGSSTAVEWIIGTHTGHRECEHPRLVTRCDGHEHCGSAPDTDFFPKRAWQYFEIIPKFPSTHTQTLQCNEMKIQKTDVGPGLTCVALGTRRTTEQQ